MNAIQKISMLAWILVALVVLIFVGANIHLIYVAHDSQTDCVPHLKERSIQSGKYRAANSAC